jgi:hypothetical protein
LKTTHSAIVNKAVENKSGSGVAQVAIWKDSSEVLQDVFINYSHDVFYDFAKPLRLLDAPGWSPMVKTGSDEGFFVFSLDEKHV